MNERRLWLILLVVPPLLWAGNALVGRAVVGRLDPVKNHPGFIAAAARLAAEFPEPYFVCIGPGSEAYARQLQAMAEQAGLHGRMLWSGACQDMPAGYNALDVFVSASLSEGSPNVLGEAMACGVTVITTDVGDAAWLMADYGQVVPPADIDALYLAMRNAYVCRAQGGKGFRIVAAKPAGQRNRQLRGKGRLPAQIGIHGFNGLDESVDGLGDHLLRTLLRHSNIRHIAVHRDHARKPPVFIPKRSAGGKKIAQLAIHQQGFGKAEGFARPVHGQRVGHKAARKLHIQLGIFLPA